MSAARTPTFILPPALIGRADIARLGREVESIDNDLESQKVRSQDAQQAYRLPTMSRSLSDFLDMNKLAIEDEKTRSSLKEELRQLKDHAPAIHFTFAVEADPEFLQQLVAWLRQEIHPYALISIGLQPSLVGGVYMRTPNRVHDFSIRQLLAGKRDVIMHELEGLHAR